MRIKFIFQTLRLELFILKFFSLYLIGRHPLMKTRTKDTSCLHALRHTETQSVTD